MAKPLLVEYPGAWASMRDEGGVMPSDEIHREISP